MVPFHPMVLVATEKNNDHKSSVVDTGGSETTGHPLSLAKAKKAKSLPIGVFRGSLKGSTFPPN